MWKSSKFHFTCTWISSSLVITTPCKRLLTQRPVKTDVATFDHGAQCVHVWSYTILPASLCTCYDCNRLTAGSLSQGERTDRRRINQRTAKRRPDPSRPDPSRQGLAVSVCSVCVSVCVVPVYHHYRASHLSSVFKCLDSTASSYPPVWSEITA